MADRAQNKKPARFMPGALYRASGATGKASFRLRFWVVVVRCDVARLVPLFT